MLSAWLKPPTVFQSPEEEEGGEEEGGGEGGEEGEAGHWRQCAAQAVRSDGVGAGGRRLCGAVLPPARARPRCGTPQAQAIPGAGCHRPRPARLHRPQAGHEAGEEGDTMGLLSLQDHKLGSWNKHFTLREFSRRFYPKRLTISTFFRRRINNILLSVQ